LAADNSRGASPRRGSRSPQRSFGASSGSLFYANMYVDVVCSSVLRGWKALCFCG
jgi:hypothetical protein